MNGKEGLDIGDLKVTKKYSSNIKNQYIEHLNLNLCFNKNSIDILNKYLSSNSIFFSKVTPSLLFHCKITEEFSLKILLPFTDQALSFVGILIYFLR